MREAAGVTAARYLAGAVLAGTLLVGPHANAERLLAAVFLFQEDCRLHGAMPAQAPHDRARLGRLDAQLVVTLERSGQYAPIAVPVDPAWPGAWICGGCELEAARRAGAQVAVTGWVRTVSELVFAINVVVRDVATGEVVAAGSVDVRGDTDDSWTRGLAGLLSTRILDGATAQ